MENIPERGQDMTKSSRVGNSMTSPRTERPLGWKGENTREKWYEMRLKGRQEPGHAGSWRISVFILKAMNTYWKGLTQDARFAFKQGLLRT